MFNKIKELTKDTAVYGISNIVGRFFGFLLVPFYTNVFAKAEFGDFSLIYAYLSFFNVFFIYGMDAAFLKYTSIAEGEKKKDTFSTSFLFVSITSFVFALILFLIRDDLRSAAQIPEQYSSIVIYVLIILILDTVALIPFANLRLERKTGKFAAIKIGNILINLIFNFILILGFKMGIEAIFISNLIASLFSLVALLPEISRKLNFSITGSILNQMLKFGLPYLPGSIAAMIVQLIDVPIVRAMTNESTLGVYRANYKLGLLMMLIVSMFNYAWQPFFLNNAKEKNAKEIFGRVLTLFVLASSFVWIMLSMFVEDIARIEFWHGKTIIGSEYLEGIFIVPMILLAYVFHGIYVNFTAGIYIEEKTKYFPLVTGAGAVVNVAINITTIPILGIFGAAIATLASYFVMAIGLFLVSQKFYKIKYEYTKIGKIFFLIFTTLILYYYLYFTDQLNFAIKLILFVLFVLAIPVLRIVTIEEIKRTINIFLKGRIN